MILQIFCLEYLSDYCKYVISAVWWIPPALLTIRHVTIFVYSPAYVDCVLRPISILVLNPEMRPVPNAESEPPRDERRVCVCFLWWVSK